MPIQSDNPPDIQTLEAWKGLNQQVPRGSIDDEEEFWNENLFAIGPGALRSCWGKGAPIYTAPAGTVIRRMFLGFYGNQTPQYGAPPPGAMGWMFLSDGTIDEVDLNTTLITPLRGYTMPPTGYGWGPVGPQYWASAKVWRPQFYGSGAGQPGGVLFGSPQQGLTAWDGTNYYKPGDDAPDWLTDQAETDPEAPPTVMPSGLPGIYCLEVYQGRLFVFGKDVCSFSAPSNGADFSTIDGGGSFGYFGDRLVYSFMDAAQSAGYLYVFGDSSTDVIHNLSVIGQGTVTDPFTTNFIYSNVDPQAGQRFPRPVGRFGRYFLMFNAAGFYLMEGGSAEPVGDRITKLWMTLDTSSFYPTMCPATMFGFRVMLVNGAFTDPFGVTRSMLLMWHPTKGNLFWSVASQGVQLTQIASYEQDSTITPYGTDGTTVWPLFATPDPTLVKRLSTKSLRGQKEQQVTVKNWKRIYAEVDDNDGRGVVLNGTITTQGGGVPGGVEEVAFQLAPGKKHDLIPAAIDSAGIEGAIDLASTSPDFTIERLHISTEERTLFGA